MAGSGSAVGSGCSGNIQTSQGISASTIKLGVTAPLSGILGFVGEEVVGAISAYAKMINAQGGVCGRQYQIISYDDQLDPTQTLANIERLDQQDKAFAVFGLFTDSALNYVNQHQVPLFTFGVTAPPFSSNYPTVIPTVGNAWQWQQDVALADEKYLGIHPKKVAILYDTTLFQESGYLPYFKQTWQQLGVQVASTDPVNLSDADCTSTALKVKSEGIDYWDFEGLGWILCASAMERIGWTPPVGMGGWPTSVSGIGQVVGPVINGMIGGDQADQPNGLPRTDTPPHQAYVAAIAKYTPQLNDFGDLESPATTGYWSGMAFLTAALEHSAPDLTRNAVLSYIHTTKNFDPGIQPVIRSEAPTCKSGSGYVWIAHWKWDASTKTATRVPETPYIDNSQFYPDPCAVTTISDKIISSGA